MIELHQVGKSFRRNRVLAGVDLRIERGERVALVGANGAGKTTLIRCLLGEYTHEGELRVDGLAPRAHRRELLARVGFVPQLPPPLKMPVGQLLSFAAQLCGGQVAPIEAMVARLGMDPGSVRRQPFVKLSGGQKQKLLIGIALGRKADVLVMDEPAANLDPQARREFFAVLAERQADSVMLISSHRLDEVAALVNRVVEMDQGAVVLDDRVQDAAALAAVLSCRLNLGRKDPALARALAEWGFRAEPGETMWSGHIAGPDRLRFLGLLSRHAGSLAGISMAEDKPNGERKDARASQVA